MPSASPFDPGITVGEAFRRVALKRTTDSAVISPNEELSYAELDLWSNAIADVLETETGQKSRAIASYINAGCSLVAGFLGAAKSSCMLLMLDPAGPALRSRLAANTISAAVLLTDNETVGAARRIFADTGATLINVDELRSEKGCLAAPVLSIGSDSPLMCVATSGSTGQPKVVVQSHRFLLHNTLSAIQQLRISTGDCYAMLSRVSHQAASSSILRPLLAGASLLPLDVLREAPQLIAGRMRDEQVTISHSTPTVFRFLCQALPQGARWNSVRLVHLGGEAIRMADLTACRDRCATACEVLMVLGSTETGTIAWSLERVEAVCRQGVLPGLTPLSDKEVRLVNPEGETVMAGEAGRLVVRGPYVASGYYGEDSATGRSGFRTTAGGVVEFFSDDVACLAQDGSLRLMGRSDNQLKIRGNRVDPGEIESLLLQQAGIREAAVVARPGGRSDEFTLAAIVQIDPVSYPGPDEILSALREALPNYMWPSLLLELDEFPRTSSLKIDRKALLEVALSHHGAGRDAPTVLEDADELVIAELWQQAGNIQVIDENSDFFSSGGDSLAATLLAASISKAFAITLEPGDIFRNPTLSQQATLARGKRDEVPGIGHQDSHRCPATQAQTGLFFRELLENTGESITVSRFVRIRAGFDDDLVARVLDLLTDRHESLRTALLPGKGGLQLDVQPAGGLKENRPERLPGIYDEGPASDSARPFPYSTSRFDLKRPPLIRAIVGVLADDSEILQLSVHHVAADGHSIGLLMREFTDSYQALSGGRPAPLVPVSDRYTAFAGQQYAHLKSADYDRAAQRLAGCLEAHISQTETQIDFGPGTSSGARVSRKLSENIGRVPLCAGKTTAFVSILAALAASISLHTARRQILFGVAVALRRGTPHSPLVGMYVNVVPVFVEVDVTRTYQEHLQVTGRAVGEAMQRSDLPFETVLRQAKFRQKHAFYPFDLLVTQVEHPASFQGNFEPVQITAGHTADMQCPSLVIRQRNEDVSLVLEYAETRCDSELLSRILGRTGEILSGGSMNGV